MQRLLLTSVLFAAFFGAQSWLPEHLSNFQNEHVCDSSVRLVRPLTISDVQEAVKLHSRVMPVGTGLSYNKEFFCAEPPSGGKGTAANIVMTTIRPLTIDVDENALSVWCSAGVTIWDLMAFLANYVTPTSPVGYAIAAPPFALNQTIAGAIATNTHGSSLRDGSLSNQVIGFKVVLANGTFTEIYPDSHPLHFKAFQVSVGRLGVVTDVQMRIRPKTFIKRKVTPGIPTEEFMTRLALAQHSYRMTETLPTWLQNDFEFTLSLEDFTFTTTTFETAGEPVAPKQKETEIDDDIEELDYHQPVLQQIETAMNPFLNVSRHEKGSIIAKGVKWEDPVPLDVDPRQMNRNALPPPFDTNIGGPGKQKPNATVVAHDARFVLSEEGATDVRSVLLDSYGVAVHVDKMADCVQGLISRLQVLKPDNGLRYDPLFRFVGKEEGLLSASNDKPILWVNFLDSVFYNQATRTVNKPFKELMTYFVTSNQCTPARLHWGEAGWPDSGCWNGADAYENTWCDFGCAVRDLDPNGKFVGSAPDRWNWEGANLKECCAEFGYDYFREGCGCKVKPERAKSSCPDPPYYTNR